MNTFLWIVTIVLLYLAIAGWVHLDTTPMIHDDSQIRRTAKLIIVLPIVIVLFTVFIVTIIVVEYWEYLRSRIRSMRTTADDTVQLEGSFK